MNSSAFTIVCQGALTIEQCVRHHAPHFDRYIVVEGAAKPGHDNARGDGRRLTGGKPNSTDGTVEILKQLEKEFDNLKVIYAKDCWEGKTSQCNAALDHALPGILWQIDSDEFHHHDNIERINRYMVECPTVTACSFWAFHFWPDTQRHCVLKDGEWGNTPEWRRVFRFNRGQRMISHEPPRLNSVVDHVLNRAETKALGIFLYHYGYCHRSQFEQREIYYAMKPGSLTDEYDRFFSTGESPRKLIWFNARHPINIEFLKGNYVHA